MWSVRPGKGLTGGVEGYCGRVLVEISAVECDAEMLHKIGGVQNQVPRADRDVVGFVTEY